MRRKHEILRRGKVFVDRRQPFSIQNRNVIFYAQLWKETKGKYTMVRSIKAKNEDEA